MKTTILFETWWESWAWYPLKDKKLAEAAWKAALASAEEAPENVRKRIGVEILERALRQIEVARSSAHKGAGYPAKSFAEEEIEKLIQELRS